MPCSECKTKVSPTKRIACSSCELYFHRNCTPTSSHTDSQNWKCESCEKDLIIKKNVTTRKPDSKRSNIDSGKEESYLTLIRYDISKLSEKFERLSVTNIDLEKSVSFCCGKLDDYGKKMDDLLAKNKSLEEKINNMENKYMKLEMQLNKYKINSNISEQQQLSNNITVSGIPITKNENIFDIIKVTADNLNIDLQKSHILSAYRPKTKNNADSKIIVKFNNSNIKEAFISEIKTRIKNKNPLKTNQIHSSFQEKTVYINHDLTPTYRKYFG